jgi:hypothetical protein
MIQSFLKARVVLAVFFLLSTAPLWAQSSGQMSLGAEYNGWTANSTAPFNGYEIMVPFNIGWQVDKDWNLYGQTAFANGSYTDSVAGTETLNLTALTDSVVGTQLNFQNFGTSAMVNLAFNIPTGDESWETKEAASNIPTEFIDTRYQGRGFGLSAMYGLAFPSGTTNWGVAAGYYYSGALNPDYGSIPSSEKLGDAFFVAVNRIETFQAGQNSAFRLSALAFLTTQVANVDVLRLGPNLNASYAFNDPKGFSYEIGGQFFLPAARPNASGSLVTESQDSLGQRFYVAPSLAFGDLSFAGMAKYITPNDYSVGNLTLYDGGGFLFGLTPSYKWDLDAKSDINLSAGYDFIIHHNGGFDASNNRLNVDYSYWTVGATYVIKL